MAACSSAPVHGPVLLYDGAGTWDVSVEQTHSMLSRYFDPRAIQRFSHLYNLNAKTALAVIPGGSLLEIHESLGSTAKNIKDYVETGGRYLGICAGGILMSEYMLGKPAVIPPVNSFVIHDLFSKHLLVLKYEPYMRICSLGLYPGPCIAPHIQKNLNRSHPDNFCAAKVHLPSEESQPFNVCSYSGPVFQQTTEGTKVLLHYSDPLNYHVVEEKYIPEREALFYQIKQKIVEESPAACISYTRGKGKLVLSAIHPEIDPATFDATASKHDFPAPLPEGISTSESSRVKLLDSMFQELGF
jgi:glutamine amidotransferase-like uncharacterized protein